jgi:ribonucleoside-diphosphate reductase alpha chain
VGADRRRLRGRLQRRRRRLRLGGLPERQPLGAATDEFMEAVEADGDWTTRAVTDGRPMHLSGARADAHDRRVGLGLRRPRHAVRHHHQRLAHLRQHGAHQRLEPVLRVHVPRRHGVQPGVAQPDEVPRRRARASTSTASATSCEVVISAQEIIVDHASYPTPRIGENSHAFRPLGIGYANLGALLMARGVPYDSDAGRDYAAAITALMSGAAYAPVGAHRRAHGALRRLRGEPRADAARHAQAPRRRPQDRRRARAARAAAGGQASWDEVIERGERTASATARSRCWRRPAPSPS